MADVKLVPIFIRLTKPSIEEARREAKRLSIPYQHVVRGWVNEGAARARRKRK